MLRPHFHSHTAASSQDIVEAPKKPRERLTLRMSAFVLIICTVGITLGHLTITAAMRVTMYEHQRVLSALTPMLPDDREGVSADDGPVHVPGTEIEIDLRGVSKGALITTPLTDRAYCRGLRPSILWSDGKRSYQLAAMHDANHDWDAISVLLGADISSWIKTQCDRTPQASGIERWVALTPFGDPAAAYVDHELDMLLIVSSLPGRLQAFDDLVRLPEGSNPLEALMTPRIAQAMDDM